MKPEQLYQNLKNLAEKLSITVTEQNLRNTGIKVRSGLCKVKGKSLFIMDKHIPINRKNEILGSCLSQMPCDDIYIIPAVREFLDNKYEGESEDE